MKEKRFELKTNVKSWNGKYVNDLENIKVKILDYTPISEIKKFIPEIVLSTWTNDPNLLREELNENDIDEVLKLVFSRRVLPMALKSIKITLLISGITTHDVTHLLRHSGFTFAADCTGDKYIENRPIIVPSFFEEIDEKYKKEYLNLMQKSYELYDKLANEQGKKVHIQDIRLVLPRTLETFYYVSGNLFDFLRFLDQRIDMQVQPKSDNILALKMLKELNKLYPLNFDIHKKNSFYCNESSHNFASKWYSPLPQNITDYTLNMKTVYGDMTKMAGYSIYKLLEEKIEKEIKNEDSNRRY